MRVCNCALAGTEACNHCPSGTMVEPYYPPLDWRDEIIAALRADNARLREAARGCIDRAQPYVDESGFIAVMLGDFAGLKKALASASIERLGDKPGSLGDSASPEAHSKSEQRRIAIQQEAKGESGEAKLGTEANPYKGTYNEVCFKRHDNGLSVGICERDDGFELAVVGTKGESAHFAVNTGAFISLLARKPAEEQKR